MGSDLYNVSARVLRSATSGYHTVTKSTTDHVFTQNRERKSHSEMNPRNMKGGIRESRDSINHPKSIPVQLYLDVTGSMMDIPVLFLKDGLPTLFTKLLNKKIDDVSLMFGAIGDHECDSCPLQVGQFESGDVELDMWLTRTFLEKGGGGNNGESYGLAWFMANNFIRTDAKDKRQQKGFVFTIGDEPVLHNYPLHALREIFGPNNVKAKQGNMPYTFTAKELYEECCKNNHVYHFHVNHNNYSETNLSSIMGQNCIFVNDFNTIPDLIADIILKHTGAAVQPTSDIEIVKVDTKEEPTPTKTQDSTVSNPIML